MIILLSLCSLLLGLGAWALGILAIRKRWALLSHLSYGVCLLSLFLQMMEGWERMETGDLTGLMDSWPTILSISAVLIIVTFVINLIALLVRSRKKKETSRADAKESQ